MKYKSERKLKNKVQKQTQTHKWSTKANLDQQMSYKS
jgi:hypothetical protein